MVVLKMKTINEIQCYIHSRVMQYESNPELMDKKTFGELKKLVLKHLKYNIFKNFVDMFLENEFCTR